MVHVLKLIILISFFTGCITITNTVRMPPPQHRTASGVNPPIRTTPTPKIDKLSFHDFFKYVGLLEHNNNPKLIAHKIEMNTPIQSTVSTHTQN